MSDPVPSAAATLAPPPPTAAPPAPAAPAAPAAAPVAGTPPAAPAAPAAAPAPAAVVWPGNDAPEADRKAFWRAIGAPEKGEDYALPVPEGGDKVFAGEAAVMMAEVGLVPQQAQKLAAWWNDKAAALAQAQAAALAQAETTAETARVAQAKMDDSKLRNEWGQNYEGNINAAKNAVREFMPAGKAAEAITALEAAIGYEQTMRLMHKLGKGLATGQARGMGENAPAAGPPSLAQQLYPGMAP